MIYIPNDAMYPSVFVDVHTPTKKEIFFRTGQKGSISGVFTGETIGKIYSTPTEQAAAFVEAAESAPEKQK